MFFLKNLNALYQLENRKGQISDFIALHEKIHYLEKDYQALKIQEAKFTSNKGLTSVWYVLSESRDGYVRPSLTMNALEALKWATETQFFLTLMATGLCLIATLCVFMMDKLNKGFK